MKNTIRHDLDLPLIINVIVQPYFIVVPAEIVSVAPHLEHIATFAVHEISGDFAVTHIETGYSVGEACGSKKQAIKIAKNILSNKSQDNLELFIKNYCLPSIRKAGSATY